MLLNLLVKLVLHHNTVHLTNGQARVSVSMFVSYMGAGPLSGHQMENLSVALVSAIEFNVILDI